MQRYFDIAYKEAVKAYKKNEIPVGAVIIKNNKIISKAYNNRQRTHNLIGHAEILAILKAEKKLKDWRLDDCEMYVTLEPCEMCSLFIKESRIKKIEYLVSRKDKTTQTNDCLETGTKYESLLKNFFKKLRNWIWLWYNEYRKGCKYEL